MLAAAREIEHQRWHARIDRRGQSSHRCAWLFPAAPGCSSRRQRRCASRARARRRRRFPLRRESPPRAGHSDRGGPSADRARAGAAPRGRRRRGGRMNLPQGEGGRIAPAEGQRVVERAGRGVTPDANPTPAVSAPRRVWVAAAERRPRVRARRERRGQRG